ncbi:MAG: class I SAM-dependent methyltransferase [Elainella sp. Prado103]|jgi:predicted O-methyltransferase YrrM|nr:class I SAM-dependent methyltransferase [Elainella sp. Prado103]
MTDDLDNKVIQAQADLRRVLEQRYSSNGAFLAHKFMSDSEAPELEIENTMNSRILPERRYILPHLPQECIFAEVGTQTGAFAKVILDSLNPKELHIIDIDYSYFNFQWANSYLTKKQLIQHTGDSSNILSQFPDNYFDVIYIDADHSYTSVTKDLVQAELKIKPEGWIICNDYTCWSPLEVTKYGVYRAVNEFCLSKEWGIQFIALHKWGYHDVALKHINHPHFHDSLSIQ